MSTMITAVLVAIMAGAVSAFLDSHGFAERPDPCSSPAVTYYLRIWRLLGNISGDMNWSTLSKKIHYRGFFKLTVIRLQHDLFSGGQSPVLVREVIDRGQAVAVLPYDPVRDEVVLVEQFRIGAGEDKNGPWLIEVIAGYQEAGESAEDVVHREASEEAGCKLSDVERIHRCYSSPGGSNEQVVTYFARTDTSDVNGIHGLDEEGEDIRVHVVSSQQAFDWLDSGRIDSAMPIIALQWFRLNRERVRRQWLQR